MQRYSAIINDYLDIARQGDVDNAFHGLLEIDVDILPELMAAFTAERNAEIRELLIEVIWQYRQPSIIPFLGKALFDAEPSIWRQALNGLVTLASPAALEALRAARSRQFTKQQDAEEFRRWLEEAIQQTEFENEYT